MPLPLAGMLLRLAGGAMGRMGAAAQSMGPGMTRMLGGLGAREGAKQAAGKAAAEAAGPTVGGGIRGFFQRTHDPRPTLPRPNLAAISHMRERLASAGPMSSQQRMMLRAQLAQQVDTLRRSKQREREDRHAAELGPKFRDATLEVRSFTLRAGGMATAAAFATGALIRLAKSSNDAAIQELRRYSPRLAALASRQELFEIRQSVARANLVGESTERLAKHIMDFRKEALPYKSLTENLWNFAKSIPVDIGAAILGMMEDWGFKKTVEYFNDLMGNGKLQNDQQNLINVLRKLESNTNATNSQGHHRRPVEPPGGRF